MSTPEHCFAADPAQTTLQAFTAEKYLAVTLGK
jgi:hypothetical protein